jgi:hypothetical protein
MSVTNSIATSEVVPMLPSQQSIGEEMAQGLVDNFEADLSLEVHRRSLALAQRRLRTINTDFCKMIADLNAGYSDAEEAMVRLYVEGCRDELTKCYLTVNRSVATTAEGRERITRLVDSLIESTLAQIKKPGGKEPAKPMVPLADEAPGGPSRKRGK